MSFGGQAGWRSAAGPQRSDGSSRYGIRQRGSLRKEIANGNSQPLELTNECFLFILPFMPLSEDVMPEDEDDGEGESLHPHIGKSIEAFLHLDPHHLLERYYAIHPEQKDLWCAFPPRKLCDISIHGQKHLALLVASPFNAFGPYLVATISKPGEPYRLIKIDSQNVQTDPTILIQYLELKMMRTMYGAHKREEELREKLKRAETAKKTLERERNSYRFWFYVITAMAFLAGAVGMYKNESLKSELQELRQKQEEKEKTPTKIP